MTRFLFFYITLFLFSTTTLAQVTISGKVKDNRGRAIIGASVSLKDSYDGAITDSAGVYQFTTTEKGAFTLQVTYLGYTTVELPVSLENQPLAVDITLKEKLDELKAVTVTAGSFEAGDKKRAATVLTSIDIATTAGSNADITSALKTLPGAQQVGEQEGLFVRGGTGYETKQYIDGTVVNNPFYSSVPDIATRGRFSPFLFKGTVFSTGGYSALYGQALSSAVILESIDLPEQTAANASVSPIFAGAGIQKLSKDKKSSWGANYGYVNLVAYFNLVDQIPDYFRMPEFHNADANFRFKTKGGGMVKYYTTFSYSELGLRRPDIDSPALKDAFGLTNHNCYNNLSWRENLGKGWKMNLGSSYSTNRDDISQQLQDSQNQPVETTPEIPWLALKNYAVKNRQDMAQVRAVFEKRLPGISALRFGSEYWYTYNRSTYQGQEAILKDHFVAGFAE